VVLHDYALYKSTFTLLYYLLIQASVQWHSRFVCIERCAYVYKPT